MSKTLTLQSDSDAINEYLMGRSHQALSPALEEKLHRLEIVSQWIVTHQAQNVVVGKILQMWPELSQPTAYRYYDEAQDVFKPQARYEKGFHVDTLLGELSAAYQMAKAQQNTKVMATLLKQRADLIEKHMGTNEEMPLDKLQPPRMVFTNAHELAGPPLAKGWEKTLEKVRGRRALEINSSHPDFEEAQVLDETQNTTADGGS